MIILLAGIFIFVLAVSQMRFSELDNSLRDNEPDQWSQIMSPTSSGYAVSFGVVQLFGWVVTRGYEKSEHQSIRSLGAAAFEKTKKVKFLVILGLVLIVLGFAAALAGF